MKSVLGAARPSIDAARSELHWPPGFAGDLARFIYQSSYNPIREVAITATLAVLAGACGRAYRVSEKDLALYIILVAPSGVGKDGIHEGIRRLMWLAGVPGSERMVRAENFASGPAIHKALLMGPGFLYLQGEFGRKLKGMANPTNTPMQDLRTVMTDAYGKQFLEGRSYSNAENSLPGIETPALSFLGETTPTTFFEALTQDMAEDGFMSRFLIVYYDGDRPLPNDNRVDHMDTGHLERWREILKLAVPYQQAINAPQPLRVILTEDAKEKLRTFELMCRDSLNASDDDFERQTFSRAHLKALKIASLLAVADSPASPTVSLAHATWAKTLVVSDISAFQSKKKRGDVGVDDHARERKLLTYIEEYFQKGAPDGYRVPPGMRTAGIIPKRYLQNRTSSCRTFAAHKLGATAALDITLRSLCDAGYLKEAEKLGVAERFTFSGKCYYLAGHLPSC